MQVQDVFATAPRAELATISRKRVRQLVGAEVGIKAHGAAKELLNQVPTTV